MKLVFLLYMYVERTKDYGWLVYVFGFMIKHWTRETIVMVYFAYNVVFSYVYGA